MIIHNLSSFSDKEEAVTEASQILMDFKFNIEQFKENIIGLLVNEKKIALFNDNIETTVKTAFTKTYNTLMASSIKNVKKAKAVPAAATGGPVSMSFGGSKFDPDI